jgi:hypothetical protein
MMKYKYFYVLVILLISCNKKHSCEDFQKGTFTLTGADKITHKIIRTENQQREIIEEIGFESEFNIKWLDKCNYIIFNRHVTQRA